MKNKKDLEYYLNLPWSYTIETDTDNEGNRIFILSVNELPGVKTDAPTLAEAEKNIKEAMIGALNLYIKHEEEIPEPINLTDFKGGIAYRTTPERHFTIAKEAQKQQKSLSKIIDHLVDLGVQSLNKQK